MKERPINLKPWEVLAILQGRKTQLRRAVKPPPSKDHTFQGWVLDSTSGNDIGKAAWAVGDGPLMQDVVRVRCPFGQVGDRLWVRETFAIAPRTAYASSDGVQQTLRPDDPYDHDAAIYREGWTRSKAGIKWRPSIHMPRWASRILLEVASIKVQRLHDISDADAKAEGVFWSDGAPNEYGLPTQLVVDARDEFRRLWPPSNGSWDDNPWVWVVEFKRVYERGDTK